MVCVVVEEPSVVDLVAFSGKAKIKTFSRFIKI